MAGPAVVVRNTFLEVGEHQPLSERWDGWRRQMSEPARIYASRRHKEAEDEEDESEDEFSGVQRGDEAGVEGLTAAGMPYFGTLVPGHPMAPGYGMVPPPGAIIGFPPMPPFAVGFVLDWQQQMFAHPDGDHGPYMQRSSKGMRLLKEDDGSRKGAGRNQDIAARDLRERLERRQRDGQLSKLKDESITHQEPPWIDVTTVMMRNLPNKYTQQMLIQELQDAGFYLELDMDFFYLPMDHSNCANLGYCFINFTKTSRANDFAAAFSGKRMRRFNSNKTAVIMPASIQGYERNYHYYVSTRVAQASDPQFRPIFTRSLPPQNFHSVSGGSKGYGKGGREKTHGGKGGVAGHAGRQGGRDYDDLGGGCSGWVGPEAYDPYEYDRSSHNLESLETEVTSNGLACSSCGTIIGPGFRFCSFCGASVRGDAGVARAGTSNREGEC